MNRIEQLIKQYCPDGVPKVTLDKVMSVSTGGQLNKSAMVEDAPYPVVNGGIDYSGYTENFNTPANSITISQGGASAGYTQWIDCDFWAGAHCYVVTPYDNINKRFLFHLLKNKERALMENKQGAGIPGLNRKAVYTIEISLPPLEVQQEIVSILDTFTDMIDNLNEELELKQKQYEYLRPRIIPYNKEGIESLKLSEVAIKCSSGSTPNKSHVEYYEGGTIPWLRTQDVRFNEIHSVDSFITEEAVKKTSVKWIPQNCVIVAISGATAGRCAINKIPLTTNQHCLNIEINPLKAMYKYVYYCVYNQNRELVSLKQGARGDLTAAAIKGLQIPIPSLEKQAEIVSILDTFEESIQNIKEEIELRQKQYEYYREQLLTFE